MTLIRRALLGGLMVLASTAVAALTLPELDADRFLQDGRVDEARVAFDRWLATNESSDELFAVLLRRLALDPEPGQVEQVVETHGEGLSGDQVAVLRMLPADFAELDGRPERALALLTSAQSGLMAPTRAALLSLELGAPDDDPRQATGAAAGYVVVMEHAHAGERDAAYEALANLVATYPRSPERHLAARQLAELLPAGAKDELLSRDVPEPTVVPYPAPGVLLGTAYRALEPSDAAAAIEAVPTASRLSDAMPSYVIQTGAYHDVSNAEHVATQLTLAGFPARVRSARAADGTPVQRVLVGANLPRSAAERVLNELRAAGYGGFLRLSG